MIEFGVVDALQFDSGGSATFYYKNFINEKNLELILFSGNFKEIHYIIKGFEN